MASLLHSEERGFSLFFYYVFILKFIVFIFNHLTSPFHHLNLHPLTFLFFLFNILSHPPLTTALRKIPHSTRFAENPSFWRASLCFPSSSSNSLPIFAVNREFSCSFLRNKHPIFEELIFPSFIPLYYRKIPSPLAFFPVKKRFSTVTKREDIAYKKWKREKHECFGENSLFLRYEEGRGGEGHLRLLFSSLKMPIRDWEEEGEEVKREEQQQHQEEEEDATVFSGRKALDSNELEGEIEEERNEEEILESEHSKKKTKFGGFGETQTLADMAAQASLDASSCSSFFIEKKLENTKKGGYLERLLKEWKIDNVRIDLNSAVLRVERGRGGWRGVNTAPTQTPLADWKLIFLGTGSMYASSTRATSSLVFQKNDDAFESWLFDCGEGTQLAAQMAKVRCAKISRIFISHLHGDHCLGLPSLLALRAAAYSSIPSYNNPIEVYGPEGLRELINSSMQLTFFKKNWCFRVHELKKVPILRTKYYQSDSFNTERWIRRTLTKITSDGNTASDHNMDDIYPDSQWRYVLFETDDIRVCAIPIQHTIPTVGYIIEEKKAQGCINHRFLNPIVDRNLGLLSDWPELNNKPKSIYERYLRNLKPGESFRFPDGTNVTFAQSILNKPLKRKITICQDTCNAFLMKHEAMNSDVVVHEATNSMVSATSDNLGGIVFHPPDGFPPLHLQVDEDEEDSFDAPQTSQGDEIIEEEEIFSEDIEGREKCEDEVFEDSLQHTEVKEAEETAFSRGIYRRGHSTPSMAGRFAANIGAKQLILTHFSQRYKGDDSLQSVLTMKRIEKEALLAYQHQHKLLFNEDESPATNTKEEIETANLNRNDYFTEGEDAGRVTHTHTHTHTKQPLVLAAWDGMVAPIYRRYMEDSSKEEKV